MVAIFSFPTMPAARSMNFANFSGLMSDGRAKGLTAPILLVLVRSKNDKKGTGHQWIRNTVCRARQLFKPYSDPTHDCSPEVKGIPRAGPQSSRKEPCCVTIGIFTTLAKVSEVEPRHPADPKPHRHFHLPHKCCTGTLTSPQNARTSSNLTIVRKIVAVWCYAGAWFPDPRSKINVQWPMLYHFCGRISSNAVPTSTISPNINMYQKFIPYWLS